MEEQPVVQPLDAIWVGRKRAIVCVVVDDDVSVVYLDNRDQTIKEAVRWTADGWVFENDGPDGAYADNIQYLHQYVEKLRNGNWGWKGGRHAAHRQECRRHLRWAKEEGRTESQTPARSSADPRELLTKALK